MSKSNNEQKYNKTAFPVIGDDGMTLRDFFAGQAIIGACSSTFNSFSPDQADKIAEEAYLLADAMMRAR